MKNKFEPGEGTDFIYSYKKMEIFCQREFNGLKKYGNGRSVKNQKRMLKIKKTLWILFAACFLHTTSGIKWHLTTFSVWIFFLFRNECTFYTGKFRVLINQQ